MTDVLESLIAWPVENLQPGMPFYAREYGWCEVASIDIPPFDPENWVPVQPSIVTLAEPKGDVTELRFPPGAQVLAAFPTEMPPPPDEPPAEEPPAGPTFHTVWRDAETGEYVTEEYANEHPDTTVSEQVPD